MSAAVETDTISLVDHAGRSTRVRHLHRPKINISAPERIGRVVMGLAAVLVGVVLLLSTASVVAVVLEVLLVVSGLDLLITGTIGHCPLYQRLSHVPKSLGGAS